MRTPTIPEDRIAFPRIILATFVVGIIAWIFLFMLPSFLSFYDDFERVGMLDKALHIPATEEWFERMTGGGSE